MFIEGWMKNQVKLKLAYTLGADDRFLTGSINGYDEKHQIISFVDERKGVYFIPFHAVVWFKEATDDDNRARAVTL